MTGAGLGRTVPGLPVRDVAAAAERYRECFGFETRHLEPGMAVLMRDDAVIHLWGATDEEWRSRADFAERPNCSGAESFIAGTGGCRIEVADVDGLYEELRGKDVLHKVSASGVDDTDFGSREFHAVDADGNLLTFYRWVE